MKPVRIEGGVKLGTYIEPMAATLTDRGPFNDPNWIFEIKWDGYRAIAEISKTKPRFYSRNGTSFDKAYPKIFNELKKITQEAIIDGEIVVFDKQGKPSFQLMQNYKSTHPYAIHFYAFDCLSVKGKDITRLPLIERKAILKKLLPKSEIIKYCDHVEAVGKEFFEVAVKADLEGVIAKRANSMYSKGKRSQDWLKIKNVKSDEAIIVGFTAPQQSRQYFGSLVLATRQKNKLIPIGNVGTGFTDQSLKKLHGMLIKLTRKTSPLGVPIKDSDITWVEPELICEIKFTEKTSDGNLRHPVFLGLRPDK